MNLRKSGRTHVLAWIGTLSLFLCLSGLAHAMPSLMGGRTLGLGGEQAARAEVGWPGMKLTYVIPTTETLDISPQFTFRYGHNLRADLVGFEPGVEVRWSFWQKGLWTLAFVADPALLLWIPTDGSTGDIGLRIGGPGMVVGWQASSQIQVVGGLRFPVRFTVAPDPSLTVPMLLDLGAEVQGFHDEEITVLGFGMLSLGPEVCLGGCEPSDVSARLTLGASVLW